MSPFMGADVFFYFDSIGHLLTYSNEWHRINKYGCYFNSIQNYLKIISTKNTYHGYK
jgi:hypothetical protein